MARKLIYVRFQYDVYAASDEFTLFTARRRTGKDEGAVNCIRGGSLPRQLDRKMAAEEWNEMSDVLFEKVRIQDWERSYSPEVVAVSDGYEWSLVIALEDKKKYEFFGRNEVPERWEDLMDVFRPYFIELEAMPEPEPVESMIDPVTGGPYPDISENVWSRFDDDGYGIHVISRPGDKEIK